VKRLHVHVAVSDLSQSIGFYSALFAAQPTVLKTDYAKWMLDDPRVNFAISTRGRESGLDHLGIQAESQEELQEVYARLRQAGGNIIEQGETTCCYAKSEKSWIDDPAGIAWETFHTTGESTVYGDGSGENQARIAHRKDLALPAERGTPIASHRLATASWPCRRKVCSAFALRPSRLAMSGKRSPRAKCFNTASSLGDSSKGRAAFFLRTISSFNR
jgi:catechol 2,3-dioxygenase-like lactoylglutathione lyase family enzyme